jgi:aspartyl-tRNA(Asn)/glutamyl-tRNA(Gln) amidotransferase subunit C
MSKADSTLTPELIKKVAHLARVELSDDETSAFMRQIGDVLRYVETLQAVDVTGVEPMTHPLELPTALREDVARDFGRDGRDCEGEHGRPRVLSAAPDVVAGGFKVPQVI